jgi:hypothetical protein
VALEDMLRRFSRDALHEKVRGVPDVPLSEASDPSCVRDNRTTRAEGVDRGCQQTSASASSAGRFTR